MNINKKYCLLIIVIAFFGLLFCFSELFCFARGINNDSKKMLSAKKEYLRQNYFIGKIISKEVCDKCPELKWGIIIRIDTISKPSSSNIMDETYPPYYQFDGDSLLHMKIPLRIYNKLELGDILVKDSGSLNININNTDVYKFLNENHKKWFQDD